MMNTEIRLTGQSAHEFNEQMTHIDMNAIAARDAFLSGVNWSEDGLCIVINDISIDLSVLEKDDVIKTKPAAKREDKYTSEIVVSYSSESCDIRYDREKESVYRAEKYYISKNYYSIKDIMINKAA